MIKKNRPGGGIIKPGRAGNRRLKEKSAEHLETQEKLQASEERIRSILQLIPDIIIELNTEGEYLAVHTAADELLIKSRPELIGNKIGDIMPPEAAGIFLQGIHQAIRTGKLQSVEYELQVPAGKRYFEARLVAQGRDRALAFIRDISERKLAEETLRASENLIKSILRSAPTGIGLVLNRVLKQVNSRLCQITGYAPEELIEQSARMLYPDDPEFEYVGREKYRQIGERGTGTVETRWRRKDGVIIDVLLSSTPIDPHDLAQGVTFTALDITERKNTEKALRLTQFSVEKAGDSVFWIGPDAKIRYANEQVSRHLGYSRDELLGLTVFEIDPDFGPEIWRKHWAELRKKGDMVIETRHRRKDGTIVPVEIKLNYIQFEGDEYNLTFVRDITERKRAEEEKEKLQAQLMQAQKMESVGRLAGGIAHDFNNMLGVILGRAELALDLAREDEQLHDGLVEIQKAARHSADLTRQLLAFARRQTITPVVLDLNASLAGMLNMLKRLVGENIDIAWNPGREIWPVKMDPAQLNQILANLCVNSRDAIKETGKIAIETSNCVFDREFCGRHPDFLPGDFVRLTVSDDGCGMDEQTLSHLFEPFFTTKEVGRGTGLGLATSYGSVRQNNGFITVNSKPGRGTSFSIHLPRHQLGSVVSQQRGASAPEFSGNGTILLVEDEPAILSMTLMMLERLGYSVLAAHTPLEALRLAEEFPGSIDLLMTDVIMPEMNGRKLAANLQASYPDLACLFMSGYTADVIADHGVLAPGVHFIQKPFSMKDLGQIVHQALQRDRSINHESIDS